MIQQKCLTLKQTDSSARQSILSSVGGRCYCMASIELRTDNILYVAI